MFRKTSFWLSIIGSIASIASIVLTVRNDQQYIAFWLLLLAITLISISFLILIGIKIYQSAFKPFERGYDILFSDISIITDSEFKNITSEHFRVIQCKTGFLTKYTHNFKFSGRYNKDSIVINSDLQGIGSTNFKDQSNYDSVDLIFENVLVYNDVAVVHCKITTPTPPEFMPYLVIRVENKMELIRFKVELNHKSDKFTKPAVMKRQVLNSPITTWETFNDNILFDKKTKSYSHIIVRPEPKYSYGIFWNESEEH